MRVLKSGKVRFPCGVFDPQQEETGLLSARRSVRVESIDPRQQVSPGKKTKKNEGKTKRTSGIL